MSGATLTRHSYLVSGDPPELAPPSSQPELHRETPGCFHQGKQMGSRGGSAEVSTCD